MLWLIRLDYSKHTRHELPPHAYATSTDAYRGLTIRRRNQSILVSGESGAGKTETVKILMTHFAKIAGKSDDKTIDKLLKANPLLESFGNAKTARNDNSSRFGKFSQLEFDATHTLVGSRCITYLLEKSLVITQTGQERNYHIMYELLAAPEPLKESCFLAGCTAVDFNYTNGGDVTTTSIENVSDADHFEDTKNVLALLGLSPPLVQLLMRTMASVLHMGQITFDIIKGSADFEAAVRLTDGDYDYSTVACSRLLGIDPEVYATNVVSRYIDVEGQSIAVPLTVEQAASGRDALAKEVYSRLFNW